MKKEGKKWMLVVLALLAVVTVTLPLVGCKNDSVAEPVRYTVKFANGSDSIEDETGKKEIEAVTLPADLTVDSGTKLTAEQLGNLDDTTNYTFSGWYDGETKAEADTYTVTENVTLTARWTQKQVAPVAFSLEGNVVTLTTATEGAEIQYKMDEDGYQSYTAPITITKETKITAWATEDSMISSEQITKEYFIVTFNTDGGGTVQSQTVESGQTATEPSPVPTKTGYTLDGWYSNSDLTKPYNFSSPVTSSFPLTAKWAPNKVGIQVELPKNPQTGELTNSEYTFTANFGEKTYSSYTWFVDGEKQENQSGATFTWTVDNVPAGGYEIRVEVEDNDARIEVEVKK